MDSSELDVTIPPGHRGFITGSSGSGKTTFAQFLLDSYGDMPTVIVEPKFDDAWLDFAADREDYEIVYEPFDWRKLRRGDKIIYRPGPSMLDDNGRELDKWLGMSLDAVKSKKCPAPVIYIDEGYLAGAGSNRRGEGVTLLWTQSRALGFVVLIASQRPAWISQFVLTESDYFYVGTLRHIDDRRRMAGMVDPIMIYKAPWHRFWFYENGMQNAVLLQPLELAPDDLDDDGDEDLTTETNGAKIEPSSSEFRLKLI